MEEPTSMTIAKDGRIFFAERALGNIKMIDLDGTIKLLGNFKVFSGSENGMRYGSVDPVNNSGVQTLPPARPATGHRILDHSRRLSRGGRIRYLRSAGIPQRVVRVRNRAHCPDPGTGGKRTAADQVLALMQLRGIRMALFETLFLGFIE